MRAAYRVPATSANLGPGFDSFGIALKLYNKFEAELADAWKIEIEGEGADFLSTDESNQVAVAMHEVFTRMGRPELKAHIRCYNKVPTGNGLGSSSTAVVGGVLLAADLLVEAGERRLSRDELFVIATELEGHADNVAPAFFGGFTVCWHEEDGTPRYARFEHMSGLAAIVVPGIAEISTREARALLPLEIAHKDAAFNVAHAGLLAASIVAGTPEYLREAFKDRLHQPYRAANISDLDTISDILLEAGCDGVALSGSGPTVIGFVACEGDEAAYQRAIKIAARAEAPALELGTRRTPLPLELCRLGAKPY